MRKPTMTSAGAVRGGRGPYRNRGDEHGFLEQQTGDRSPTQPVRPPLGDTGAGLDEGGRRRGAHHAAAMAPTVVDQQWAIDLRQVAVLVEVAGLLAVADEGPMVSKKSLN
jgi:hypothetical protein